MESLELEADISAADAIKALQEFNDSMEQNSKPGLTGMEIYQDGHEHVKEETPGPEEQLEIKLVVISRTNGSLS